ncbi:MAG: hypothetical protein ACLQVY_03315 [Limisphaerales bacterium]
MKTRCRKRTWFWFSRHAATTGLFLALGLALSTSESSAQSTVVPYNFTTIAGELEVDFTGGYMDGSGASAQFNYPEGVAVDTKGNLYVADRYNHVIRQMTPRGQNWAVATLAGQPGVSGYFDSPTASSAQFNQPRGVAVDTMGNVFVADSGNNVIREITSAGVVSTIAGSYQVYAGSPIGGYVNGPGLGGALFNFPTGIAVDSSDNLYVADNYNNVIRKLTKGSSVNVWDVSLLAGSTNTTGIGANDGTGEGAQFNYPWAVAVDTQGYVYVADTDNNEIRKITPGGVVSTLAGFAPTLVTEQLYYAGVAFPNNDGTGGGASFFFPSGVAVDSAGNVYAADSFNSEIRKITPGGQVTTLGGQPAFANTYPVSDAPAFNNGSGSDARFFDPVGIAVDGQGNLYVGDTDNCVIREGTAPAVQAVALEVIQAVQDLNNSVPLIAGKETYVRAHLQLAQNAPNDLTVAGAQLVGTGPSGPLPGSPLTPINPNGSLDLTTATAGIASDPSTRASFANSLNFRLPDSWLSGSITLQLTWPGGLQAANVLPADCSVQVTFVGAAVPRITFITFNWVDSGGTQHLVDPGLLNGLPDRVLACFPVASVNAAFFTPRPISSTGKEPTEEYVLDELVKLARNPPMPGFNQIFHGVVPGDPANYTGEGTHIYGSTLLVPGPVSYSVMVGSSPYGQTRQAAAHELAHNLGIYHDVNASLFGSYPAMTRLVAAGACGEQGPQFYDYSLFQPFDEYPKGAPTLGPLGSGDNSVVFGFDSLTYRTELDMEPVLAPLNDNPNGANYYFDLMSYCYPAHGSGAEGAWPSSVTYATLMANINNTFCGACQPFAPLSNSKGKPSKERPFPKLGLPHTPGPTPDNSPESYLVVQGRVNFQTATVQFFPCTPLTTTNAPPTEPSGTNFVLEALDATGDVLDSTAFSLEPNIFAENSTNETAYFTVYLTANSSIHTLTLSYNGALWGAITAGPSNPALALTTPNGGQNFTNGATVNLAWAGSEPGESALSYTVEYSADDGAAWQTLFVDLATNSVAINSSFLAASTQGLIHVIASDGINTTTVQSAAPFIVQPHPPAINLNAPLDGSIFIGSQQVFLDATVNDRQDGPLSGTNVQWFSDRDGALGPGKVVNFPAITLSEGLHTITVKATDNEGLTSSAVTRLLILHNPPPQLSLQITPGLPEFNIPAAGTLSWPFYYTNYVLQSASSLGAAWITVTNPAPEINGNQYTVNLSVTNKTSFFRLLMQP